MTNRSFPLAAFLTLRRSDPEPGSSEAPPPRPDGNLIWAHVHDPADLAAFSALAARLGSEGDQLSVLVTVPLLNEVSIPSVPGLIIQHAPAENRTAARAFLRYWRPAVLLWHGGNLRPVLLHETAQMPMTRFLLDVSDEDTWIRGGSWVPGITRGTITLFQEAMAKDGATVARLRRAGLPDDRIRVTGRLDPGAIVLPCIESDRQDLARALGTRPVWLAAKVPVEEIADVIEAHRIASRRAHRLLLILSTPHQAEALAMLKAAGLETASRLEGQDPTDNTQVLLTDTVEMGLWYRLAPISFLGGTLSGQGGSDPFEAAALGSAVVHGHKIKAHRTNFDRLSQAGATRTVANAGQLGRVVEALLAPDKTAEMAHAAWDVTSAGAESSNKLVSLIREALDRAEG